MCVIYVTYVDSPEHTVKNLRVRTNSLGDENKKQDIHSNMAEEELVSISLK